jgi:hypothetical protein
MCAHRDTLIPEKNAANRKEENAEGNPAGGLLPLRQRPLGPTKNTKVMMTRSETSTAEGQEFPY